MATNEASAAATAPTKVDKHIVPPRPCTRHLDQMRRAQMVRLAGLVGHNYRRVLGAEAAARQIDRARVACSECGEGRA